MGTNKKIKNHSFPNSPLVRVLYLMRLAMRVALKNIAYRFGKLSKNDLWNEIGTILYRDLGGLKGPLLKIGQMMSYLIEEMPQPIQLELRKLLVNSKSCDFPVIRDQIELQLGKKISDVFAEFDESPFAVGSTGQIHKGQLLSGEIVAVKVAIPGIKKIIQSDMKLLKFIVPLLELTLGVPNMKDIFEELKELMIAETNFLNELEYNLAFQKICANDPEILIPRVYPEYCSPSLLVMEYVEGKTFFQFMNSSSQSQKNRAAEVIWEFSSRSANRFLLFNGDPHPGNYIFLADGRVGFVDFGFCKRWDSEFHARWKRQTIAGMAGNLDEFTQISKSMGIISEKGTFDYSFLMDAYQKYSYVVWSGKGQFQFNRTSVKKQLVGLISAHTKISGVQFPKDLLVMTRLFWGLQSVMALLNAQFDVARLTIPYLEQDSFEPFQNSMTKRFQNQVQKIILGSLPNEKRISTIRENVKIPKFSTDPRFEIVICKNQKEYETAFKLLHDSYVGQGLMNPIPEGLRCGLHSFLPETTTILAKFNGLIVGTLSLNLDSRLGLPSDSEFKTEIDQLRFKPDSRLIEVTGFAVDKDFRNQGNAVSMLLMKYLYVYTKQWLHGTHLVCAVRKKVEDFYVALFLFQRHGPIVNYRAVNSVEGVFLSMEISDTHEQLFKRTFSESNNSEFAEFILAPDGRLKYPQRLENVLVNFALTPEILEYFLLKRSRIINRCSSQDLYELVMIHKEIQKNHPALESILNQLASPPNRNVRKYRAPVHIKSKLITSKNEILNGTLKDMNSRGAFLQLTDWKQLSVGQTVHLRFEFLKKSWAIKGHIRWLSAPGVSRIGCGIGLSWEIPVEDFDFKSQASENLINAKAS